MKFLHLTLLSSLYARILKPKETQDSNKNERKLNIIGEGNSFQDYEFEDFKDEVEGLREEWDPWDLSEDELKTRLTKLVNKMDKNNDSLIDSEELLIWTFKAVHAIDTAEYAEEDFSQADENEDGFVSFDEFTQYEYAEDSETDSTESEGHEIDIEYNRMYNRVRARFRAADDNNDNQLDSTEFKHFKNPFSTEERTIAFKRYALEHVDVNNDGIISETEYFTDWKLVPNTLESAIKRAETEPEHTDMLNPVNAQKQLEFLVSNDLKLFNNLYDRNSNGVLDGLEIILWLSPESADSAMEEAESLLDICDEDENGTMTLDEIMLEIEMWVDSDATEYGKQLRHFDEL